MLYHIKYISSLNLLIITLVFALNFCRISYNTILKLLQQYKSHSLLLSQLFSISILLDTNNNCTAYLDRNSMLLHEIKAKYD